MDSSALLSELHPTFDQLLNRHLAASKEWFPHEMVPWSRGRDYVPGDPWDPDEFPLPDPVRRALLLNLLTEDNLPYYFSTIHGIFTSEAFDVWTRRWTAEEMRHATVIRDWLMITRAIDAVELERGRMAQVSTGQTPQPGSIPDAIVYLCLQELATRIAHRNTGKLLDDPIGYDVMARVAADENLHYLFYRDLGTATLAVDPSAMVLAIERQVRDFEMPGTGIPGFSKHAAVIAKAGIYDLGLHHDQILVPVILRHWKLTDIEGLTPEAEEARERLVSYIDRMGSIARRLAAKRAREQAEAVAERPPAMSSPA